jgi:hypothetical protein
VNDALPARRRKGSRLHLLLRPVALAPLPLRPAPLRSQASSNKERRGNAQTVAKWAISKRTKSVTPDFLLIISYLLLPLLQGRGNAPPGLLCRQRGIRILQIHLPRTLMKIGCSTTDKRDATAGGFVCISRYSTCTRGRSYSDHGPFLLVLDTSVVFLLLALLFCSHPSQLVTSQLHYILAEPLANQLPPRCRLCPLLNGTIRQDEGFNNAAFMGAPPTMP